jgi:peptidoglycan DL-endopeptidase CwlO
VVAAATLVVPVAVSLALPGPAAPPASEGDGTTSLAVAAHGTLLAHGDRYRAVAGEGDQRRTELAAARAAAQTARGAADAAKAEVGTAAADLFRAPVAARVPVLGLSVEDPAAVPGVLYRQALTDRTAVDREGAVVRAERAAASLAAAERAVADAEREVAVAENRAERLLADARAAAVGLDPAVAAAVAGLGNRPATADQQERGRRAVARWQAYLTGLAEAGIEPPPAADLTDPGRLPAGLSPALDAAGDPVPGVAWAVVGSSPVTVLPAETVAAVSSALSQLGTPYAPGGSGPDAYDCGGFTAASWLRAGFALPGTPAAQWRTGTAVPVSSLQVGDLVLSPGGLDVGLYVGAGEVLGASAATYRVGIRPLAAGSSAVRVPLGAADRPNAPQAAQPTALPCGAAPPARSAGPTPDPSWGGWSNGSIPSGALCELGVGSHALRCDAAAGYAALAQAYAARFGTPLCITDSYRSFGAQVTAFALKPGLAAVPGTSNHGWALAVDLCGGVNGFGTPQWRWMAANAGRFGWVQPSWAGARGKKPEPWHWEFGVIS